MFNSFFVLILRTGERSNPRIPHIPYAAYHPVNTIGIYLFLTLINNFYLYLCN
jgi:hypothetical protein